MNPFRMIPLPHPEFGYRGERQEHIQNCLNLSPQHHCELRNQLIGHLYVAGLSSTQISNLNLGDINHDHDVIQPTNSEVILLDSKLSHLFGQWLTIRMMFALDRDALFIALKKSNGYTQAGKRLSARAIRMILVKIVNA